MLLYVIKALSEHLFFPYIDNMSILSLNINFMFKAIIIFVIILIKLCVYFILHSFNFLKNVSLFKITFVCFF